MGRDLTETPVALKIVVEGQDTIKRSYQITDIKVQRLLKSKTHSPETLYKLKTYYPTRQYLEENLPDKTSNK